MGEVILDVNGLTFRYGESSLFEGMSFTIKKGDFVFLLGENGSGKSTLMKLLSGILIGQSGLILLEGRDLIGMRRKEVARKISFAGDDIPYDFPLTVRDYVSLGIFPKVGFFGSFSMDEEESVSSVINMLGLTSFSERYLHDLSAGEKQRALLARALAQGGDVLIFDEPAAHLDLKNSLKIFSILEKEVARGKTVIVSSHDPNLTGRFSRKVLLLKGGKIISFGERDKVLRVAPLKEAFGVNVDVDINPGTGAPRVTITE